MKWSYFILFIVSVFYTNCKAYSLTLQHKLTDTVLLVSNGKITHNYKSGETLLIGNNLDNKKIKGILVFVNEVEIGIKKSNDGSLINIPIKNIAFIKRRHVKLKKTILPISLALIVSYLLAIVLQNNILAIPLCWHFVVVSFNCRCVFKKIN